MQVKFINMMNRSISFRAGEEPLQLDPYSVRPLEDETAHTGAKPKQTNDNRRLFFFSLLRQGSEKYLNFVEPFDLDLNGTSHVVSLHDGTRNTLVLTETDAGLLRYISVRMPTPVASATSLLPFFPAVARDLPGDTSLISKIVFFISIVFFYCLNLASKKNKKNLLFILPSLTKRHDIKACLYPQFEDINAKPEEGNNALRQVSRLFYAISGAIITGRSPHLNLASRLQ